MRGLKIFGVFMKNMFAHFLKEKVPDWVAGELTSSVGSSLFRSNIGNPAASSTWKSGLSPIRYESSPRRYSSKIPVPKSPTSPRYAKHVQ